MDELLTFMLNSIGSEKIFFIFSWVANAVEITKGPWGSGAMAKP